MLQISRFSRFFLIVVVGLFLFASLFVFREPIMAYKDPWTGRIFGEGSVVGVGDHVNTNVQYKDVEGKVIMPLLGNATVK